MTPKQREKMKNRFVTLCKRIHEMSGRPPLRKFSHALIEHFDEVIEYWWNNLDQAYSDPKRHYHDWQHIIDCLELFYKHRHEFMHPIAAEVAIWFHDFVYDAEKSTGDNEEKSAEAALEFLEFMGIGKGGAAPGTLRFYLAADHLRFRTKNNILATKNHSVVPGYGYYAGDQLLICDIDLAVLGRLQHPSSMNIDSFTEPTYYSYAAGIRKEYEHVLPEIYCTKRAGFLEEFLKQRQRIYSTDYFFNKFEKNAQTNIAWEIKQLRAGNIPTL